jgi:hypothetical protein
MGLHQSAVSVWRSGKRKPTIELVLTLREYLGWSVDRILSLPQRLEPDDIDEMLSRLSGPDFARLYKKMGQMIGRAGPDTVDDLVVTTAPSRQPPQLTTGEDVPESGQSAPANPKRRRRF